MPIKDVKKRNDLQKEQLYEALKSLENGTGPHFHLNQQKLFTLGSIAFQYLLYKASRNPGIYLIRIEDGHLADKLAHKSKDETSRRLMEKILLPRRLKVGDSTFVLDYFQESSWTRIQEMPISRFRMAVVIRNTTRRPFHDRHEEDEEVETSKITSQSLDFLPLLMSQFPQTLTIAYDMKIPDTEVIRFDFINDEEDTLSGVKITDQIYFD